MWSDSLAAEGWGLYAEELMAEPVAGRPYGFYTAGGVSLRAAGTDDAGRASARRRRHSHRPDDIRRGARLLTWSTWSSIPGRAAMKDPDARAACERPTARSTATRSGRRRPSRTTSARTQSSRCARRPERTWAPPIRQEPFTKGSCEWERCPSSFSATRSAS